MNKDMSWEFNVIAHQVLRGVAINTIRKDKQKVEKYYASPWITLAMLSGLGIVAMSAETMVLPAIPEFIEGLDISYEDSSWILAAPLVTGAVMTPIAGKLSDIYGKKRILLHFCYYMLQRNV